MPGGTGGTDAAGGNTSAGPDNDGDEPILLEDDRCDVAVYDPASPPQALNLSGNLGTHDPAVIEQDGVFYLFNTGAGLPGKISNDLRGWNEAGAAFNGSTTSWVPQEVPAARDLDGKVWMFFGSHWDGVKAIELDPTGESTVGEVYDIAARPEAPRAVEAPFVVRRCGYYYLFVSFDQCCNNWNDPGSAPYNIRVGRATRILGPYTDKDGTPMYPDGGGTLLLGPGGPYPALGHNAVIFSGDMAYNIYHAYNPATLRVAELVWDEGGWPISGGP